MKNTICSVKDTRKGIGGAHLFAAQLVFTVLALSIASPETKAQPCTGGSSCNWSGGPYRYNNGGVNGTPINLGCTTSASSNNWTSYGPSWGGQGTPLLQFTAVAGQDYTFSMSSLGVTTGSNYLINIHDGWVAGAGACIKYATSLIGTTCTLTVLASDLVAGNNYTVQFAECGSTAGSCVSVYRISDGVSNEFLNISYGQTGASPPSQPSSITPSSTICAGASQIYCLTNVVGVSYAWSVSGAGNSITAGQGTNCVTINWATSGTITVIPSVGGCNGPAQVRSITVGSLPTANAGSAATVCAGQPVTLSGSGGGTYSWAPSSGLSCASCANTAASPTSITTYTLSVTNGCGTSTDAVTVSTNSLPVANAGAGASVCNGQSVTLNGSGGGLYSWSPAFGLSCTSCSNPVASPTTPTTYTLTVSDAQGCTDTDQTVLDVSALPTVNASPATICSGQSATITATGGGSYSWNTGATTAAITVTPTVNSNYTVTVINSSGCTNTAVASVNLTSSPAAAISGASSVCSGSLITLTALGGGTYSWNTGATTAVITVSQSAATTYSVVVSSGSCTDTATTTLAMYTMPTATISTASTNVCIGTSATLTASGGGSYSWNTGSSTASITVSPTIATSYTVTVTNTDGCTDTDVITMNPASTPVAAIVGNSTICAGQSTSLSASGGGTYTWSTGATTASISVSPAAPTTYSVIVAIGSCTASATSNVTVNPTPTANISTASTSICAGQNATLTATGGGTYVWSTGSTSASITVSPTIASSYTATVSNGLCTSAAVTNLTINTPPAAAIFSSGNTICSGTNAVITASGGGTYLWNTGETTASISVSPSAGTTYSVLVSNGMCTSTATQFIAVNPSPTANAGVNISVINGNSATLTASGGGTYLWDTGETTSSIMVNPASTTTYTVIVTNSNGCTALSTVTVFVQFDCGDFFIPSAFSPNDDAHNDVFFVRSKCLKSMTLVIYDRWGAEVFETDNINEGWDGFYKGQPGDKAVYCYVVNYELITGDTGKKKGTVTLVR